MNKKLIWSLLLIAVCALVFVCTGGATKLELFSFSYSVKTPLALLFFTGIGVVIGVLLK